MAHGQVMKLVVPLRLFARSLCRNTSEADRLVKDTLDAASRSLKFEPVVDLKVHLFSLMRKIHFGALGDDVLRSSEPENFLACMCQDGRNRNASVCEHEVEAAIGMLPVHLREALALVMILDQSIDEAAMVIGCDTATVSQRVVRARNLLQLSLF